MTLRRRRAWRQSELARLPAASCPRVCLGPAGCVALCCSRAPSAGGRGHCAAPLALQLDLALEGAQRGCPAGLAPGVPQKGPSWALDPAPATIQLATPTQLCPSLLPPSSALASGPGCRYWYSEGDFNPFPAAPRAPGSSFGSVRSAGSARSMGPPAPRTAGHSRSSSAHLAGGGGAGKEQVKRVVGCWHLLHVHTTLSILPLCAMGAAGRRPAPSTERRAAATYRAPKRLAWIPVGSLLGVQKPAPKPLRPANPPNRLTLAPPAGSHRQRQRRQQPAAVLPGHAARCGGALHGAPGHAGRAGRGGPPREGGPIGRGLLGRDDAP